MKKYGRHKQKFLLLLTLSLSLVLGVVQDAPVAHATPPAANKYVGIQYTIWFDQYLNQGTPIAVNSDPPFGGLRMWGQPAQYHANQFNSGPIYRSSDPIVINKHADLLATAGIDFIEIDLSNGELNNAAAPDFTTALIALLDEYEQRHINGDPTPKISFLFNNSSLTKLQELYQDIYQQYPADLFFNYGATPLLMVTNIPDSAQTSYMSGKFTWKHTAGFANPTKCPSGCWSFLELSPQPKYSSNSFVEELPVSPAQQVSYMSDTATAHGRTWSVATGNNSGLEAQNFYDQWGEAKGAGATVVLIKSWNEWMAINNPGNQCGIGVNCYTDEYNRVFSTDLEPMTGGHGDAYYNLLMTHIGEFKANAANILRIDYSNNTLKRKYGRGGSQLAAQNYVETTNGLNLPGTSNQSVTGDFNADGRTDMALRNTVNGIWYFYYANTNGTIAAAPTNAFTWAAGGHYQAFAGQFDGIGAIDIGLRDTTNGTWHFAIGAGNTGYNHVQNFAWAAGSNYQPIVADFNADSRTDIGLRDTSSGQWHFAISTNNWHTFSHTSSFTWAAGTNYQPLTGDYNCDSQTDIGLYDSSNGKINLANNVASPPNGYAAYAHRSGYMTSPGNIAIHTLPSC